MAAHLTLGEIKRQLSDVGNLKAAGFDIMRSLCSYTSTPDTANRAQDLVLRALEHRDALGGAAAILDGLVRQLGLFPYLEQDTLGLADSIAYEFHKPENMEEEHLVFHRVQAQVYNHLLNGNNVVLSAPTSFGKSLIIDAIVASGRYKNLVIVEPTLALIDETRRRLSRYSRDYKIITHGSQSRTAKNLLVMTQERVLEMESLEPVDFFVIDEFYKLQPRPEDRDRSLLLNEAFYALHKTGAQFYLLGPNIKGLDGDLLHQLELHFIKTDYKTVASEVNHIKSDKDDLDALTDLCRTLTEPTLIYCSSPSRARKVAEALLDIQETQSDLHEAVEWIGSQYDPEWLFVKALARGIGIHHGKIPRALSQLVVKNFNEGLIKFMACTSTLIEGVNTKAKNVIVFDNKIAKRKFDYFTYNNILGRSGRMFQHFVGNVYIFHDPPAEDLPFVDFPIFSQPDDAPSSMLMQIDEDDMKPGARERVTQATLNTELDLETLRLGRGIDPEAQTALATAIRRNIAEYAQQLSWNSYPATTQLLTVCELIWRFLIRERGMRSGVSSGKQLAFRIGQFRRAGGATAFIKARLIERGDKSADDAIEEAIDFLRIWANFAFPRYLLAIDRIQRSVLQKSGRLAGDFRFFAGLVQNWFLDPAIMALDEYGIPVQLGEKLEPLLSPEGDLDKALSRLKEIDVGRLALSPFEAALVRDAIEHL